MGEIRRSVAERYASACVSSSLQMKADTVSAADVIAAAGMVGAKKNPFGVTLLRVMNSNDREAYRSALDYWRSIVRHQSRRRSWRPFESNHANLIAKQTLDWWLWSICNKCQGRKYESVEGVPHVLSDKQCRSCKGTGRVQMERLVAKKFIDRANQLIPLLDIAAIDAEKYLLRKLKR